jgi:hypothetical protein
MRLVDGSSPVKLHDRGYISHPDAALVLVLVVLMATLAGR